MPYKDQKGASPGGCPHQGRADAPVLVLEYPQIAIPDVIVYHRIKSLLMADAGGYVACDHPKWGIAESPCSLV